MLEHHAHTHPHLSVMGVSAIFAPDKHGFGLAHDRAPMRLLIVELIGAHESGLMMEIRKTCFGDAS